MDEWMSKEGTGGLAGPLDFIQIGPVLSRKMAVFLSKASDVWILFTFQTSQQKCSPKSRATIDGS